MYLKSLSAAIQAGTFRGTVVPHNVLMADWVGYAAAILATSSFLPQVIKTIRSGQTKDISLSMYLLLCSGVALWFVYGLLIHATPVIVANLVTLALSGTILFLKLKNG